MSSLSLDSSVQSSLSLDSSVQLTQEQFDAFERKRKKACGTVFRNMDEQKKLHQKLENIEAKIITMFEKSGIPKDVTDDLMRTERMGKQSLIKVFRKHKLPKADRYRLQTRVTWFALKGMKFYVKMEELDRESDDAIATMKQCDEMTYAWRFGKREGW